MKLVLTLTLFVGSHAAQIQSPGVIQYFPWESTKTRTNDSVFGLSPLQMDPTRTTSPARRSKCVGVRFRNPFNMEHELVKYEDILPPKTVFSILEGRVILFCKRLEELPLTNIKQKHMTKSYWNRLYNPVLTKPSREFFWFWKEREAFRLCCMSETLSRRFIRYYCRAAEKKRQREVNLLVSEDEYDVVVGNIRTAVQCLLGDWKDNNRTWWKENNLHEEGKYDREQFKTGMLRWQNERHYFCSNTMAFNPKKPVTFMKVFQPKPGVRVLRCLPDEQCKDVVVRAVPANEMFVVKLQCQEHLMNS